MDGKRPAYDVLIIGGGPSGATAALMLARAGVRTLILEKGTFPRFHVGESFLPQNLNLIRTLGLEPKLRALPHLTKLGAEFGFGDCLDTTRIAFDTCLDGCIHETFNIARAPFDAMLLDAAVEAGADVRQNTAVKRIVRMADGDVAVEVDGRAMTGSYLLDASGQATVVGKHLGLRRGFEAHRKIAYFGHFEKVKRLCGREEGYPTIVMCDEGWFWLIPIDDRRTSIGLVLDADVARGLAVPASQMLTWGIARSALMRDRTAQAVFPERTHVMADFSYRCKPYAGPGYFLLGDAAVFLDPVFSSGICLCMMGAVEVANQLQAVLGARLSPGAARRRYARFVERSSAPFFRLVKLFYEHSFRELFMTGEGPLDVHRAVISILAGYVFPRPAFSSRWRMRLFEWLIRLNRHVPLVPRRTRFSLVNAPVADDAVAVA